MIFTAVCGECGSDTITNGGSLTSREAAPQMRLWLFPEWLVGRYRLCRCGLDMWLVIGRILDNIGAVKNLLLRQSLEATLASATTDACE